MAYFHCLIGGGSSGGGYELTVTCDADFAGTTITATDGVTTLTQTCPSASPYKVVFAIPNGGTWTVSGTISGSTYTASIDIPDELELTVIPEGSTVLPTDDIQTWLACAGITDKAYTTLNEVLSDSTTLLALISDNNASDYLVRSTTWASGLTADSTAMTDIGANNYCANTLLADSTWLTAICNSTYFESVLNTKVPTMTGYDTPSGEVIYSTVNTTSKAWYAFDGNLTTEWINTESSTGANAAWVGYDFGESIIIYRYALAQDNNRITAWVIEGTNDKTGTWNQLASVSSTTIPTTLTMYNVDSHDTAYRYYRFRIVTTLTAPNSSPMREVQFYGRKDV